MDKGLCGAGSCILSSVLIFSLKDILREYKACLGWVPAQKGPAPPAFCRAQEAVVCEQFNKWNETQKLNSMAAVLKYPIFLSLCYPVLSRKVCVESTLYQLCQKVLEAQTRLRGVDVNQQVIPERLFKLERPVSDPHLSPLDKLCSAIKL